MLLFCTDVPTCGRMRQEDGPSTPAKRKNQKIGAKKKKTPVKKKKKTPAKKKLKKAASAPDARVVRSLKSWLGIEE